MATRRNNRRDEESQEIELTNPDIEILDPSLYNVPTHNLLTSDDLNLIERITEPSLQSVQERTAETMDKDLSNIFELYNAKFGTNLTTQSLTNVIEMSLKASNIEIQKQDMIRENFLYNYSKFIKFKMIIAAFKIIEKNLQHILSLPPELDGVDVSQVLSIEKIWVWLDKVNGLIEEFKNDEFENLMADLTKTTEEGSLISEAERNKLLSMIYSELREKMK